MAFGEHPNMKRVDGKLVRECETCKRVMRVTDRCEWHKEKEPCYFCHLNIQHLSKFDDSKNENSKKKTVKPVA